MIQMHQTRGSARHDFHETRRDGRLWLAVVIVLSLFLGYKAATLVFQLSESAATQALLDSGKSTQQVYSDDGRATAENARGAFEAYLGFFAAGDAESATNMAGPRASGEDAIFLSNKVFSQAKEHISGVSVTSVDELPEHRFDVHYSYTLAGTKHKAVVQLHRKTARWVFEPLVVSLTMHRGRGADTDNFSISGVNTSVADGWWGAYLHYSVYPAVYQIDAPTGGFFVGTSVDSTTYTPGDNKTPGAEDIIEAEYAFHVSEQGEQLVQKAASAYLNECLTIDKLFDPSKTSSFDRLGCGRPELAQYRNVTDLDVEVLQYPVLSPDIRWPNYGAFNGRLKLSFSAQDNGSGSNEIQRVTNLEVPVNFYGFVARLEDGKVILE